MSIFFYSRPAYIDKEGGSITYEACQSYAERAAATKHRIPDALSFDKVLNGQTLPPTSLVDFMDYLVYVSRDAENLQFLLWLRDYTTRFEKLPEHEAALSPEWRSDSRTATNLHDPARQHAAPEGAKNSFDTTRASLESRAQAQPFRAEVNLIIQHYLSRGAPRELNLPYRLRDVILQALTTTTHPSAFKPCRDLVEQCIRNQSHPNFIRWAIGNGRRPRTLILRQMCAIAFVTYIAGLVLLVLSGQTRWHRIILAPILFVASLQLQAVFHGFCMILFLYGTREQHPWEMFATRDEVEAANELTSTEGMLRVPSDWTQTTLHKENSGVFLETIRSNDSINRDWTRLNPFGTRNGFEHEAWASKWDRTRWYRKYILTFSCGKIPQAEKAITLCQSKIFWQSMMISMAVTIIVSAGVVCIPEVNLF